jgi:hypothetical protein
VSCGVADGTRTHDDQNHNLGLYQLSYSHRRSGELYARALRGDVQRGAAEAASTTGVATLTSAL